MWFLFQGRVLLEDIVDFEISKFWNIFGFWELEAFKD